MSLVSGARILVKEIAETDSLGDLMNKLLKSKSQSNNYSDITRQSVIINQLTVQCSK